MYAKESYKKIYQQKNTLLLDPFTSHCVLITGDPIGRSSDALQVGIRERRESGGRAEGRKAQTPTRGGFFS